MCFVFSASSEALLVKVNLLEAVRELRSAPCEAPKTLTPNLAVHLNDPRVRIDGTLPLTSPSDLSPF